MHDLQVRVHNNIYYTDKTSYTVYCPENIASYYPCNL